MRDPQRAAGLASVARQRDPRTAAAHCGESESTWKTIYKILSLIYEDKPIQSLSFELSYAGYFRIRPV